MAAKVRREDVPAQAQRGNHRQKYLPAPAESMKQNQGRPMRRTFGIIQAHIQRNFAGVEGLLDQASVIFAHGISPIIRLPVERRTYPPVQSAAAAVARPGGPLPPAALVPHRLAASAS